MNKTINRQQKVIGCARCADPYEIIPHNNCIYLDFNEKGELVTRPGHSVNHCTASACF